MANDMEGANDKPAKLYKDNITRRNFGGVQPGAGRPKGSANRASVEFKETVRMLLQENHQNVSIWLQRVAEDNPAKALELLTRLAEFAVPRLKSVELAGDADNPLRIEEIKRLVVDPLTIDQGITPAKESYQ